MYLNLLKMIIVYLFYIDAGGYFWVFSQNKEMLRFKTPKLLFFFKQY